VKKRSADYWKVIFEKWAKTRGKEEQLESYAIQELNEALSQFYVELRKENGHEYKPDSLKVIQAALDRYLRSQNYSKSILRSLSRGSSFLQGKRWKEKRESYANKE